MQNKQIKTTLLLLTALGILIGIFQYSDSVLTAPQKVEYTNKHIQDIDDMISTIPSSRLNDDTPSLLLNIIDKIELCQREKFITSNERDELFEKLIARYVPAFITSCRATFGQSVWHISHLDRIKSHIDYLSGLTIQNGTRRLIAGSYLIDMNEIKDVIARYYAAKKFLAGLHYVSIDESKQQIAQANSFKTYKYLAKCTNLIDELNDVPRRLNDLHYAYLEQETQKLKNYRYMSEEQFKRTDRYLDHLFASYRNNAMSIYSTIGYMASLDDTHMKLYYTGLRYYDQQREKEREREREAAQRRNQSSSSSTSSHASSSRKSSTHSSSANTKPSTASQTRSYTYSQYPLAINDYVKSHANEGYEFNEIVYGKQVIFIAKNFEKQFSKESKKSDNKLAFDKINQIIHKKFIYYYVPFTVNFKHKDWGNWAIYHYIAFFDFDYKIIDCCSYTPAR